MRRSRLFDVIDAVKAGPKLEAVIQVAGEPGLGVNNGFAPAGVPDTAFDAIVGALE